MDISRVEYLEIYEQNKIYPTESKTIRNFNLIIIKLIATSLSITHTQMYIPPILHPFTGKFCQRRTKNFTLRYFHTISQEKIVSLEK